MLLKLILILLIILLGLIIVLPFVLNIAGINVLQFGTPVGGTGAAEDAILLRTPDSGGKWENSSVSEDERVPFPSRILSFVFHPTNPDIIFLGAKSTGLWKTANSGAFWTKVGDRNNVLDQKADVQKIVIGPTNPNLMYIAVFQNKRGRVLKTEDGGESFGEVYFTPADNYIVSDIHLNPRDLNHLIITTGQGGILESRNGGKTWRVVKWFTGAIEKLLVNPFNVRDMLLLTSNEGMFKSVDGGENWADLTEAVRRAGATAPALTTPTINPFSGIGLSQNSIQTLVPDPNNFSILYIGSREGLLRSHDGGFTWKLVEVLIPPDAFPVTTVAVHPRLSNTFFIGASNQVHRTDDNGINWSVKTLPTKAKIKALLIHPLRPEIMFAILGR